MKITDCHNDFLTEIKILKEKIKYIQSLKCVKKLCCAVFTTEQNLKIKDISWLKNELYILQTYTKTKLMLTIEDIGFVKTEKDIEEIIKLKPFSVTLTWNNANNLAGGANDNGSITEFGITSIKQLENKGIIIDTAHLNRSSFFEFAKITSKPIFNSHTNINELYAHNRNLTDEQIKLIVDSNGFMGITIYKDFISNNEICSDDIVWQFDYLIKKFGYKNFGFGTDFYGIKKLPNDIKNYFDLLKIKNKLKKLGYSNKIIKHIFYKNFNNYLKRLKNNFK